MSFGEPATFLGSGPFAVCVVQGFTRHGRLSGFQLIRR